MKIVLLDIQGIKCDSCPWANMKVPASDYAQWLNKPCPCCNANLLTQADFDTVQKMLKFELWINRLVGWTARFQRNKPVLEEFKMNGTGKLQKIKCSQIGDNTDHVYIDEKSRTIFFKDEAAHYEKNLQATKNDFNRITCKKTDST